MIEWGAAPPAERRASLTDRFVVPPFSVLDTRQGYWQERRRAWLSLGMQSELGRGGSAGALDVSPQAISSIGGYANHPAHKNAPTPWHGGYTEVSERIAMTGGTGTAPGTSIFDPVLCELVYRWWCPAGGAVLDPFAGGSVRGIVAARLGHPYTGVDLSAAQVAANAEQAARITPELLPTWLVGDSRQMAELVPTGEAFDLVFTCPPYYDLEVYSADPRDLSAMRTYGEFLEAFREVMAASAARLRDARFAVIVVSEIRDREGFYRGLVPATVALAHAAGLRLYNEACLINSVGTLPLRVPKQFDAGRKLGRCHQNVLVFAKGNPERGWSYDRPPVPTPQLSLFGDAA